MSLEAQAKERILLAAQKLFTQKGYEQVTVREIAREAKCSHTSIYVYFEDKKQLLEALAEEPLDRLRNSIQNTLASDKYGPQEQLTRLSKMFVHFGLSYRNLYQAFLTYEASRVDIEETIWELNEKRLELFVHLKNAVKGVFPNADEKQLLDLSRMIYFLLHGIIMTYKNVDEHVHGIIRRVFPIVERSINYLIQGGVYDENNQGLTTRLQN
ncbi:TetR/AcrR family transcriptional regulator [Salipaludibacillus agaradhaerens]|uniref:TetR/AcrR family transcriptional regulator n=1 Tax=Salipaludibacillus agaradhaerens TaxID=76935 RepID=UPI002151D3FA|nr:TetR/AcrR family transcriptional regulator [Salipaludibacillus agaradhaerens]MCR6120492.1 TetR/AcrR family transcriptional regulator [Salipaludibacillus agaradhaerens]